MRLLRSCTQLVLCVLMITFINSVTAQTAEPFECKPGIYQVISGQLNILNPVTGNYVPIGPNAGFSYNNLAWNTADNFMYAMSRGNGTDANGVAIDNRDLIKIDKDGEVFFVLDTGESGGAYAGDIVNGELWIRRTSTRYQSVNLTTLAITEHTLSQSAPPADWVLIGDYLYGAHTTGSYVPELYVMDTRNGNVTKSTISGISGLSGYRSFGAAYAVNQNQLYFSHNNGGLFIIDDYHTSNPRGQFVVPTQVTNSNDGASCNVADFPQALVGLAMDATQPTDNGDGTYNTTFTITVENLGNMDFHDLSITDNLTSSFGSYTSGEPSTAGTYTITSAPAIGTASSDPFTVNSSFTGDPGGSGVNDHNVIVSNTGSLLAGETSTISFGIKFNPSTDRVNFNSQAVITGDIVGDEVTYEGFIDFSTQGSSSDGDSNNNPVDDSEVTYFNINEICDNGIDDDGDGLIDCDDPDCDPFNGCIVSGGTGGGLESNDNLISKIAKREFERTISDIDFESKEILTKIERPIDYGEFEEVNFRNDFDIEEFIPIDIFPQLETLLSTPEDLVEITNATEVASVDMYRGDNRLAAVLAIKSEGVYEHAKYVCDRVKGAEIRRIFNHKFDGEHDFIVNFFKNRYGDIEYNTNFSVYINDDGDFTMESHWDLDNFDDTKEYYNFQIWANGLLRLDTLASEVLRLLEVKKPISAYEFTEAPKVYAKSLYYDNEKVIMNIVNQVGAKSITVAGSGRENETSNNKDFSYEVTLSGAEEETIEVPTGALYSFGADIIYDETSSPDVLFTADGFWGLAYQKENTTVNNWEVQESNHSATDIYQEDASWIERNFEINGSTENFLTVYRSMNPAFRGEDFTDYNTLSFEVEGSGELEVIIIKSNIDRMEKQMRTKFTLDGSCKRVYLKKQQFRNNQRWNDVKMIYFTQRSKTGEVLDVDLKIGEVAFLNLEGDAPSCEDYNKIAMEVYPNPTKDAINFHFPTPFVEYEMVLTNQLGQVVYSSKGDILFDGKLTINEELEPGLYHYQFKLPSGTLNGTVIKTQ